MPAPRRVARRPATTPAPAIAAPAIATPLSFIMDINEITPYAFNPRDNREAIPAIAASIAEFGFLVPVVIDADNVLVTGHTRVEAAKTLGMTEVTAIRAEHLSEEAIAQFRLIDNKVAEIADWDHEALATELAKLADFGIDWTRFGWTQNEIDCLHDMVADDCLEVAELHTHAATAADSASAVRAPATTRFVFGEVVFFVPQAAYRHWLDGIRSLHNFDKDAVEAEIIARLGIQPV